MEKENEKGKKEENFICSYCAKVFKKKGNMKLHVDTIHEKSQGKFVCSLCEKRFPRKDYLEVRKINSLFVRSWCIAAPHPEGARADWLFKLREAVREQTGFQGRSFLLHLP